MVAVSTGPISPNSTSTSSNDTIISHGDLVYMLQLSEDYPMRLQLSFLTAPEPGELRTGMVLEVVPDPDLSDIEAYQLAVAQYSILEQLVGKVGCMKHVTAVAMAAACVTADWPASTAAKWQRHACGAHTITQARPHTYASPQPRCGNWQNVRNTNNNRHHAGHGPLPRALHLGAAAGHAVRRAPRRGRAHTRCPVVPCRWGCSQHDVDAGGLPARLQQRQGATSCL